MVQTNEFERDLIAQAGLKRPGRIDLVVFQNIPDAGDGNPGVQRCFRNYLHEGGFENDLDLLGFSIIGTSVNISNAELQQLSNIGSSVISSNEWSQIANIGAATINGTQWGYVGAFNQGLTLTSDITFNSLILTTTLSMSGNIIMGSDDITFTAGGTVDGVDVSILKSDFDAHKASTGSDHTYINQDVTIVASPRFVGLNIENIIQHFGDVDNEIQFGTGTQTFQVAAATTILDLNSSGLRIGGGDVRVTKIQNSDSLGSALDTVLCTQGNVKAYADTKETAFSKNTAFNDNYGSSAGQVCQGNDSRLSNARTPVSHGYSYHSDINQPLLTTSDPTFDSLTLTGTSDFHSIRPSVSATYNNGAATRRWLIVYCSTIDYCQLNEATCADFSDYTAEELADLLTWDKRTDGIFHHDIGSKKYFPHIDFATIPDEFSFYHEKDEPVVYNSLYKKVNDKYVEAEVTYNKGEKAGIIASTVMNGMRELLTRLYIQVQGLKDEIEILKNL